MAARFECVATLSDHDNDPALVTPGRLPPRFSDADSSRKLTPIHPRAPLLPGHSVKGSVQKKRSRDLSHNPLTRPDMVARTRAIVYGKCRCATRKSARNCFVPFRNSQTFVLLTTHLRKLGRMDKLELDKEAGHTTLTHSCVCRLLTHHTISHFCHSCAGVGCTSCILFWNQTSAVDSVERRAHARRHRLLQTPADLYQEG